MAEIAPTDPSHFDPSQANGENVDNSQNGDSAPKKRDRWSKAPDPEPTEGEPPKPPEGEANKKKSRWGTKQPDPVPASPGLALVPFGAPIVAAPGVSIVPFGSAAAAAAAAAAAGAQVNPVNPEQLKVQLRIAEIQNLYNKPSLEDYVAREYWDPEKKSWETGTGQRSPSPEPAYDRLGRRTNTRDLRMRMRLQKERQSLLEKLCQLQPSLGPAFSFPKEKKTAKLFIPQKEYPNYPFIGLILGPRGNTQKKLEKETGAKIIIRGKGSVKDGKRAKMDNDPSQDEELHVHISADTDESVCTTRDHAKTNILQQRFECQ